MRFSRAFQRRFGITAPRLAVRTHLPWHWRWVGYGIAGVFAATVGWWMYDTGLRLAGFERSKADKELQQLTEKVQELTKDNHDLRSISVKSQQQLEIERVTQSDLAKSIKMLQDENASLKEDIAFFRSMMSPGKGDGVVSIYSFRVDSSILPGEYRYKLLLFLSGKREKEFQGAVQLVVNCIKDGERVVMTIPDGKPAMDLHFKFYQRVEGTFHVPPGTQVKNVQARVFENGESQAKLMKTVSIL